MKKSLQSIVQKHYLSIPLIIAMLFLASSCGMVGSSGFIKTAAPQIIADGDNIVIRKLIVNSQNEEILFSDPNQPNPNQPLKPKISMNNYDLDIVDAILTAELIQRGINVYHPRVNWDAARIDFFLHVYFKSVKEFIVKLYSTDNRIVLTSYYNLNNKGVLELYYPNLELESRQNVKEELKVTALYKLEEAEQDVLECVITRIVDILMGETEVEANASDDDHNPSEDLNESVPEEDDYAQETNPANA